MAVTETGATLSIYGRTKDATAAAVTLALGIEPTSSHEFGDPHPSATLAARGRRTENSRWGFSEPETEASEADFHGMLSLDRLAERFEPKAEILAALSERYEIRVWLLGHSDDESQHGFVISAATMRRLGVLSASLWPDIYSAGSTDPER